MSNSPLLPRGTPLTPTMELTTPNGVQWVVYIEGVPPVRRWRLLSQTLLPGRRMRFDSAGETRVTPTVPAGSPFLSERRLLALLTAATPLPPEQPPAPHPAPSTRRRWEPLGASVGAWCGRASGYAARVSRMSLNWVLAGIPSHAGREAVAYPSALGRRRDPRASWRRALPVPAVAATCHLARLAPGHRRPGMADCSSLKAVEDGNRLRSVLVPSRLSWAGGARSVSGPDSLALQSRELEDLVLGGGTS